MAGKGRCFKVAYTIFHRWSVAEKGRCFKVAYTIFHRWSVAEKEGFCVDFKTTLVKKIPLFLIDEGK